MRNKNIGNEQTVNFNDGTTYLGTINWLMNSAHVASNDPDQDVYDWFEVLEQLHTEIDGFLFNKEDTKTIDSMEKERKATRERLNAAYKQVGNKVGNLSGTQSNKLRNCVYPYHILLNRVLHKHDLRGLIAGDSNE